MSSRPVRARHLALCLALTIGACSARQAFEESAPAADTASTAAALTRAAAQAPLVQRALIRTVSLELVVEDVARARKDSEALVAGLGGYVQALESSRANGRQSLQLTLRVPKDKLDGLLQKLRSVGALQHESQLVEDVTRNYVDVDARLRNLTRTEERLLALLQNGQSALSDVLAVERELSRVRSESDVLSSEFRALSEQIALSTVKVSLEQASDFEPPASLWTPMARLWRNLGGVFGDSMGALIAFAATLLTWTIYSLPWLPVLFLLALGVRRLRGYRKRRRA